MVQHNTPGWHDARGWRISPHLPILLYLGLLGTGGLVSRVGLAPDALRATLPHWMVIVWTVSIAGGGVAGTFGVFERKTRIETVGLVLMMWGALMYGATIAIEMYPHGFYAAAVAVAISSMCGLRMHDLHDVRETDRSQTLAMKVQDIREL